MRLISIFLLASVGLVLAGCQKHSADNKPYDFKALVNSDILALQAMDESSAQEFDKDNRRAFSKIFGGTDSFSVLSYLHRRIHYYWTLEEMNSYAFYPSTFTYTNWEREGELAEDQGDVKMGAANVGIKLWLLGAVNNVVVQLYRGSDHIAVEAPNVGIMLIGEGYTPTDATSSGRRFSLPAIYRQGILLHEARHSDCTGGLTEADLQVLREASNYRETDRLFKKQCGHLHKICPPGHDLEGIAACDDLPWGAYTVSYIFSKAMAPSVNGMDRTVMDATVIDMYSRLLFNADAMMRGELGEPDMTSQGIL